MQLLTAKGVLDSCFYALKISSMFKFFFIAASINKGRTARGVSETANKLANMSIATRRQSLGQTRPPPMKAGVNWTSESGNILLRSSHPIPTGRTFTKKVAG